MTSSFVLSFHDIYVDEVEKSTAGGGLGVSLETLKSIISCFREEGFRFVSEDYFLENWSREEVILLTFDDGYESLYKHFLPLAIEEDIPATFFIVRTDDKEIVDPFPLWLFSWKDFCRGLDEDHWLEIDNVPLVRRILQVAQLSHARELVRFNTSVFYNLFYKHLSYSELKDLALSLSSMGVIHRTTLDSQQIKQIVKSGLIKFGAHSVSHRCFFDISDSSQEYEVIQSVKNVAEIQNIRMDQVSFAYPYGAVTKQSAEIVKKNCLAGFTTMNSRVFPLLNSKWLIPRIAGDNNSNLQTIKSSLRLHRSLPTLVKSKAYFYTRTLLGK